MEEYKGLELSTQLLIAEAIRRGIDVRSLIGRIILFGYKGSKVEYIKQATRTSVDTYIAPLIMENKEVTRLS